MILNEYIRSLLLEFFDQKMQCIGMIPAQDPQKIAREKEEEYNTLNDPLLSDIKSLGLEYFPTFYYGKKGFFIPNISKQQLMSLGKSHSKSVVIWGSKVVEGVSKITFNWQYLEDGKIRGQKISHHPFVCPNF